ncbi:MAG: nuclear transport factor 2 family protein [Verrucomicrobiota bacterium]
MTTDSIPPAGVSAHSWHASIASSYVLFTPVDLIREVYARYTTGDRKGVTALLSPEIEITHASDLPWGGRFLGHAGARRFYCLLHRHTDASLEPRSFLLAGSEIAVGGKFSGVARASGKPFSIDMVQFWTVSKGRAVRCASFIDVPAMRRALAVD